jgi:hypothetical protein
VQSTTEIDLTSSMNLTKMSRGSCLSRPERLRETFGSEGDEC